MSIIIFIALKYLNLIPRVQEMWRKVIVILAISAWATCEDCGDNLQCAEENLIQYVNNIDSQKTVPVLDGFVTVEKTKEEIAPRNGEDIVQRLLRYLSSHEIKIKIPQTEMRSIEERSKKLRKLILPLLLVLKLKAAIIIPAFLSLITILSFKGLGASFMALAIAGATGLKSLLETHHHSSRVSYEVVPQISATHLWNRAGIDSFPLGQGYHTIV